MGETVEETDHLLVAPHCLQNKVIHMIDREIEPALAMSDNIPALRRLTSLHATVKEVKYENSVYTVVAYCE